MSATLGAKDVARTTGVSTDTLRHYERKGLLPNIHRTSSGYRRYPAGTIDRVLLIQRALVVGFSLDDLARVLSIRDRGGAPCRNVRAFVGERISALDRQIEGLVKLRDELRELLIRWDETLATTPAGHAARLLDTLSTGTTIEQARKIRQRSPHPR